MNNSVTQRFQFKSAKFLRLNNNEGKIKIIFYFILFFITSVDCFLCSQQQPFRRCIRVVDGDTIILDGNETVRLLGVDTPEKSDSRKLVRYFGFQAAEFTRKLVEGKIVRLEYDKNKKDLYHRTLAYVFLKDGKFVNSEIIKQGYGFTYTKFPFKYLDQFRQYEREARENRLGLWASSQENNQNTLFATNEKITVYVTKRGQNYHTSNCHYLRTGQIPMSLKDACANGYIPCSTCKPPSCK